jgi:hypothetical protein
MVSENETQKPTKKTTEKRIYVLGEIIEGIETRDDVKEALNAIVRGLNRSFNARVELYNYGSSIIMDVYHSTYDYSDLCGSACMTTFKAMNCAPNGYVEKCYETCRRVMREEAFVALYDNYRLIIHELRFRGIDYSIEVDNEELPLHIRVHIKL